MIPSSSDNLWLRQMNCGRFIVTVLLPAVIPEECKTIAGGRAANRRLGSIPRVDPAGVAERLCQIATPIDESTNHGGLAESEDADAGVSEACISNSLTNSE